MGNGVAVSWGLRWTAVVEDVLELAAAIASWGLCWIAVVSCSGLGPVPLSGRGRRRRPLGSRLVCPRTRL
jgi:hypothetical protein